MRDFYFYDKIEIDHFIMRLWVFDLYIHPSSAESLHSNKIL